MPASTSLESENFRMSEIEHAAARRSESLGLLLGLAGVTIFAATLPMTRFAVGDLGPWFLAAGRAAGAGLLAAVVLAVLRRPVPRAGQMRRIALVALMLVGGFSALTGLAMQTVPAAHGGVVTGLLPLATVVVAALIGGERPSAAFWICAVAGTGLVVAFMLRQNAGSPSPGDWLLVAAMAAAALGYALSGRLSREMPGWEVISWAVLVALPLSLPLAAWTFPAHPSAVPASAWLAFAYLAVMSMYLGFFAWNTGLALGGVARVSQVQLAQPFLTIGIAAILTGEKLEADTMAFAVAIVAVIFVSRRLGVRAAARG